MSPLSALVEGSAVSPRESSFEPGPIVEGIVRSLSEASLLVTRGGDILVANDAAGALFGTPAASLRGSHLTDHVTDAPADVARYLTACARTGSQLPSAFQQKVQAPGGALPSISTHQPVAGAAVRVHDAIGPTLILLRFRGSEGMNSRFILLNRQLHDLTREVRGRRVAEAALRDANEELSIAVAAAENARAFAEQANHAKSEFLAVMSHELRTPLNAIGGYVELLELGIRGALTAAQREDLSRIQRAQRHLLMLINEVLDFARVEAGRVDYSMTGIPVDALLRSIEPLIAPQLLANRLSYSYDGASEDIVALGDREKLEQILLNLLSNAIKFTPPHGMVTLACESDSSGVRILVRDTGVGIAPEQLVRIFEPFVQLDQTLTRTRDGVGLGLAISRDLARGMFGDLTANSVVGAGSTFIVTLRAAATSGACE